MGYNGKRTLPEALKNNIWKPGQSGNPNGIGGPVATFMRAVRDATDDGQKILEVLMAGLAYEGWGVKLKAAEMLLERGWGKAPQLISMNNGKGPAFDWSKLSDEKLKSFMETLAEISKDPRDTTEEIKDAEIKSQ